MNSIKENLAQYREDYCDASDAVGLSITSLNSMDYLIKDNVIKCFIKRWDMPIQGENIADEILDNIKILKSQLLDLEIFLNHSNRNIKTKLKEMENGK